MVDNGGHMLFIRQSELGKPKSLMVLNYLFYIFYLSYYGKASDYLII